MARKCSSSTVDRSICLPTARSSRDEHCDLPRRRAHHPPDGWLWGASHEDVLGQILAQGHMRLPMPALGFEKQPNELLLRRRSHIGHFYLHAVVDQEPALEERRTRVVAYCQPRTFGRLRPTQAHENA